MTVHMSMTHEQMMAQLLELRAENQKLRQAVQPKLGLKVSEKGAVSLYGIRRFPVTFYAKEWRTILGKAQAIEKFIVDNAEVLSSKDSD